MFSHMTVGSNDLERSRTFYDALFAAIGSKPGFDDPKGRIVYMHDGAVFLVTKPLDGEAATPGNGMTIGFKFDDEAVVDRWHEAGVGAGGSSVEDPPGVREGAGMKLYLAYLRDPDGNKLCALKRMPA